MTGSDAMSEQSRLTATTTPTLHVDVDGTRFAYRQLGPDSEVPLVFLHHFTATIDDWDPQVLDGIAAERRAVVFDNRGIGGSAGRVPTTVDAMAADAIDVIRALGHDRVDLLGFSLGGFITQVIATIEPSLVRRMVLAGTGPAGSTKAGLLKPRVVSDFLQGAVGRQSPKPLPRGRPRRRLPVPREVRVAGAGVPGMTEDDKENGRW
jgi:pimeloyl-ACP methyl ester carboxylesterase